MLLCLFLFHILRRISLICLLYTSSGYIENEHQKEECEHTREVASKYGIQVVCNEEETAENQLEIHLPESEACENEKKIASKYGVQLVCDENM